MIFTRAITLTLIAFFMLGAYDSVAQQLREMLPLEEHDFECLQSLECVQDSQSLKSKGWSFIFDNTVDQFANELTAYMKGENIYFFAVYDKNGGLIRSMYKHKNAALPRCLLTQHSENNLDGWRITGSELIIKNFDPSTLKYKVRMESENSEKSEIYDSDLISDIHRSYLGVAEVCVI